LQLIQKTENLTGCEFRQPGRPLATALSGWAIQFGSVPQIVQKRGDAIIHKVQRKSREAAHAAADSRLGEVERFYKNDQKTFPRGRPSTRPAPRGESDPLTAYIRYGIPV
jgi:hypothetical protein